MGITALISTLLGFLGGVIPDVMKEVRDSRNAKREADMLKLQSDLQIERMKLEAGNKLRDAEAGIVAEEMRAMREHLTAIIESQAKPTGIRWIDGFNAVLRPIMVALIMVLFMATAVPFTYSILAQYAAGTIADAQTMANIIWGSLVGGSIEAVLGFLFGYRSAAKKVVAP